MTCYLVICCLLICCILLHCTKRRKNKEKNRQNETRHFPSASISHAFVRRRRRRLPTNDSNTHVGIRRRNTDIAGFISIRAHSDMETIRTLSFLSIVLSSLTIVSSFPCPPECICEPSAMIDVDFTRMRYAMHCGNLSSNDGQLIYNAEPWSIADDTILDDDDDDFTNEYQISIDLAHAASLERFDHRTIQFTGFSFTIESLSLANQSGNFSLVPNAFNSSIYQTLHCLNLSSCCQKIPTDCQRLFSPLKKLRVLDLSGSAMYRSCLGTPGTSFRGTMTCAKLHRHRLISSRCEECHSRARRCLALLDSSERLLVDGRVKFDMHFADVSSSHVNLVHVFNASRASILNKQRLDASFIR